MSDVTLLYQRASATTPDRGRRAGSSPPNFRGDAAIRLYVAQASSWEANVPGRGVERTVRWWVLLTAVPWSIWSGMARRR